MHRLIADAFANLLIGIHIVAAAVFAALVIAATQGYGPLSGPNAFITGGMITGTFFSYLLFFGATSVVIRANENLERIADLLEAGARPGAAASVDAQGRREPAMSADS
jgi:uncharacterized membrane protein